MRVLDKTVIPEEVTDNMNYEYLDERGILQRLSELESYIQNVDAAVDGLENHEPTRRHYQELERLERRIAAIRSEIEDSVATELAKLGDKIRVLTDDGHIKGDRLSHVEARAFGSKSQLENFSHRVRALEDKITSLFDAGLANRADLLENHYEDLNAKIKDLTLSVTSEYELPDRVAEVEENQKDICQSIGQRADEYEQLKARVNTLEDLVIQTTPEHERQRLWENEGRRKLMKHLVARLRHNGPGCWIDGVSLEASMAMSRWLEREYAEDFHRAGIEWYIQREEELSEGLRAADRVDPGVMS